MALFRKSKQKNLRPTSEVCRNDGMLNAADTLLANIRFSEVDDPVKVICVASACPNDGKTTVTMSLGMAMSRIGAKVLLVEADMRRRSMRAALDVKTRYGIHGVLVGDVSLEEAVVSTDFENLFFLDAEAGIPNPEQLLNSKLFAAFLEDVKAKYDYVLLDVPPILAFADASIISNKADGMVLVLRQNVTERRDAQYALEQLQTANARVLGLVMNGMDTSEGNYEYYYKYYNSAEQSDHARVRDASDSYGEMDSAAVGSSGGTSTSDGAK